MRRSASLLSAVAVLVLVAGCAQHREAVRRDASVAALAKYPGNVQKSDRVQVAAVDYRGEKRIELRNFGVFEVKRRAPRKARNPRTGDKVYVPSKNVVTFKPGKEMEELVRKMNPENLPLLEDAADADEDSNGPVEPGKEPRLQSSAGANPGE